VHDDFKQRGLGEGMVLTPQRWRRPPTVHREGANDEDRGLTPWYIASRVSAEVGVAHHRAAVPGECRTGGGLDHRQLSSSAHRPPHGKGAPHLRDE
jgi:hypothetical protein